MIYSIPNADKKKRVQFVRKLSTQTVKSHSGKYTSKTIGILPNYNKLANACIVFDRKYLKQVKELTDQMSIQAKFFLITAV